MTSLIVVLAVLALVTGVALTGRPWPLAARVPLIVAAPWVAFAAWHLAQPSPGWPAPRKPPRDSVFVAGVVREPDPATKDRGEIDLWLTPPGASRPRAYRLPYTRQLHEQVQQARDGAKHGGREGLRRDPATGRYRAYLLPPAQPPRKTP